MSATSVTAQREYAIDDTMRTLESTMRGRQVETWEELTSVLVPTHQDITIIVPLTVLGPVVSGHGQTNTGVTLGDSPGYISPDITVQPEG